MVISRLLTVTFGPLLIRARIRSLNAGPAS